MTLPYTFNARELLQEIIAAHPRCFTKPDDYLDDNISETWAMVLCQDCPVILQCRNYSDIVENNRTIRHTLGAVYGGQNGEQRANRRTNRLTSERYADHA